MPLRLTDAAWPERNPAEASPDNAWASDRTLHSTHRSLLDRLYRLQQFKGYAWIGRDVLARQCGLHPRHLRRLLGECRDAGWLAYLPGKGRGTTLYRVVTRSLNHSDQQTDVTAAQLALAAVERPGHDVFPGFQQGRLITGGKPADTDQPCPLRGSAHVPSEGAPALPVREEKSPLKGFSSSHSSPRRRHAGDRAQGDLFRGEAFDPFKQRGQVWGSDSDVGDALRRAAGDRGGLMAEIDGKEWLVTKVAGNQLFVRLWLRWQDESIELDLRYRPQLQQVQFWRIRNGK